MRDEEKSARGLLGRVFSHMKRDRRGETTFTPDFEYYYEIRLGCLKFPFCGHVRTDRRQKCSTMWRMVENKNGQTELGSS